MEKKKILKPSAQAGRTAVMERPRDMTEQVRKLAYSLYEKRRYAHGNDWHDWFEAEKLLKKGM